MFKRLASPLIALAIASTTLTPASAAFSALGGISNQATPAPQISTEVSNRSGHAKLQRLLRPHLQYIPITQDVKNATGNPNITVLDRRGFSGNASINRCSYIFFKRERVLICD